MKPEDQVALEKAREKFRTVAALNIPMDIFMFQEGIAHRDAQPAVAQGDRRQVIQDARVDSFIISRAMEHPIVLEIMAACAEIIETESSAVVGPEYDGSTLRSTAKRLLEQAARIRESDPDIWEDCPVGGITQTAPAVAQGEPDAFIRVNKGGVMTVVFNEVSIKGVRRWTDESGKKRQETRKFFQTINPFNKNADGTVKTKEDIFIEISKERDLWLSEKARGGG